MWNSALSPIIAAPIEHRLMTRPFIFKCPITNQHVQGWLEDEDAQITEFEGMTCPACMRLHFLNRKTGELLGAGLNRADPSSRTPLIGSA